ncbi:MAG: hypothetical protein P4M11_06505 [Candidatus Pacebacteria bacterium]|nr:hypothetical protein [Candidatus Paceibacterota bacterium]
MKKYIGIAISSLVLLIPAGLAFADNGQGDDDHQASIQSGVMIRLGDSAEFDLQGQSHEDISENDGSSTNKDPQDDKIFHGGKHGTTTEATTSSDENHNANPPITAFWNWLLGLPATTTVGDLRTQIEASTTASSTAGVPVGISFFQHLLSFLTIGK